MKMHYRSDRLAQAKEKHEEMMDSIMEEPEYVPVDLNGARTDFPKGQDNLSKAQEDIRRRFDMNLPTKGKDTEGGEY